MAPEFSGAPVLLCRGRNIITPPEPAEAPLKELAGKGVGFPPMPFEPQVRRIVDIGAGIGAFAAYAALRWPYAWIDCYEEDEALARILRLNMPPGGRVFTKGTELKSFVACDLLHIAMPLRHPLDQLTPKIVIVEFDTQLEMIVTGSTLPSDGVNLVVGEITRLGSCWQAWAKLALKKGNGS